MDIVSRVFPPQEAVLCEGEVVWKVPAGIGIAVPVLVWLGESRAPAAAAFAAFSWVLELRGAFYQ